MILGLTPAMVILFEGNLAAIQSTAVIGGAIGFVMFCIMIFGFIKTLKKDKIYIARKLKEQEIYDLEQLEKEYGVGLYDGPASELNPYESAPTDPT